jgi:hypothetical protein
MAILMQMAGMEHPQNTTSVPPLVYERVRQLETSRRGRTNDVLRFPNLPSHNSVAEISNMVIFSVDRKNIVFRRLADGFLCQIHEHLGFQITDPIDLAE